MNKMSIYSNDKVRALPNGSEGQSKEELEHPGKGATLVDWEEYHNQQMRFADYEKNKTESSKKTEHQM